MIDINLIAIPKPIVVCPICDSILESSEVDDTTLTYAKICQNHFSHKLFIILRSLSYQIIAYNLVDHNNNSWNFYIDKSIFFYKNCEYSQSIHLPYFKPDFSNLPKLLNKLYTYITFL